MSLAVFYWRKHKWGAIDFFNLKLHMSSQNCPNLTLNCGKSNNSQKSWMMKKYETIKNSIGLCQMFYILNICIYLGELPIYNLLYPSWNDELNYSFILNQFAHSSWFPLCSHLLTDILIKQHLKDVNSPRDFKEPQVFGSPPV